MASKGSMVSVRLVISGFSMAVSVATSRLAVSTCPHFIVRVTSLSMDDSRLVVSTGLVSVDSTEDCPTSLSPLLVDGGAAPLSPP